MALTYDQISAITGKYFVPKLVDNIFNSNVLFARMRGKQDKIDGGTKILVPVAYATTSAAGSYSGADELNTTPNDQITSLEFDWKQYYANITITGKDELQNSGDAAKVSFVKSKVQIAEKSLASSLGTAIFNVGTASAELIGLRLAIDSTGTYGGISRADYSWLAAQEDSSTTVLSLAAMETMFGSCTIGNVKPSLIITTQAIWDDYFALLQPQQRFQDTKTADAGWNNLTFRGVPIVVDSHCPSGCMFFINEDYIQLYVHSKRDFKYEGFIKPVNQDIATSKIFWMGALTCSNCRLQGKFTAIA